ncbi:hypothetical protein [Kordiimonas pumila]|uniref:Protein kinase domain-containing protein n=1 Tax=Kordiimonas pumila TaxID=2161677 RepID=A0ABV7D8T4_9PROT|nr:hypothetical protein [Kordiimonas pumila]
MSGEVAPVPTGQSAFGDRYEIIFAAPLPEFSTRGGKAYKVKDKERPKADLYAIVHIPLVPVRNDIYLSLQSRPVGNVINPVARGLMNIEDKGRKQRLVTVFDRPTGGALMAPDGTLNPRVNTVKLRQNAVLSALKALAALHKRGLSHRNVLPTTMFFASPESDEVLLGECYSFPAGYMLPFAMEPLELAFADTTARGVGDASSDFYQLGAALQSLYFGEPLWKGRDRDGMAMARINQGSFWSLSGGREIPGALGTLIRGLMADELEERWGSEEILDWFEGIGKPKRTTMASWTMNRPTNFMGTAYVDRRLLADAFSRNPQEAAKLLKSIDFPSWIQMAFRDEIMTEKMESVLNVRPSEGFGGPRADDYRMVSRVCMFLHPTGPVYYKGYAITPSGVPALIAEAFSRDDRETMTNILEIFDAKFISALTDIVGDRNPTLGKELTEIAKAMEYGPSKQLGKGMERVLYELNLIIPCVSLRFENVWIGSLKQMLRALDRLSSAGGGKNILLDRHVAAYCATHGVDLERDFNKLAAVQSNPAKFNSLTAEFFGLLQRRMKLEALPHLTEKLVDGLAPTVRDIKNKKRREQVQVLLDKVKKEGDITKLITDVNLTQIQALDAREFSQACNAVVKLEKERARLSKKISPRDPEARQKGYRGARVVAFVAFMAISFLTFYQA